MLPAVKFSMDLDHETCYRAILTRDPRFDGRLFIGVHTTGIYCRPVCPARMPKPANVSFYPSAAAAQEAGFRPCLRCRPERSPDLAAWRGTSNTVTRALALIGQGAMDEGVETLAERLGVGERHLRRLFNQHLGASPIAIAQTRRVLFAKQLITETRMPLAEIALAAGFGSVRRFNAIFRELYQRPPRELRRKRSAKDNEISVSSGVTIILPFRPPYDWPAMIRFLSARAIPGVELVDEIGHYHRSICVNRTCGKISAGPDERVNGLRVTIQFPSVEALAGIVGRIRCLFDLSADPLAIGADLSTDPFLAPLVALRPGLRVPGAWDGFELAARAILGQQITVRAASMLAGRLVTDFGCPLGNCAADGLTHAFPSAGDIASANLELLPMPKARSRALLALARIAALNPRLFSPSQTLETMIERLRKLPGIGEWTAQYIAMRALREPDAFPAADIGLLRALTDSHGRRPTAAELLTRAEQWRPWRAYAAMYLWTADLKAAKGILLPHRSRLRESVDAAEVA
jgi:AraC family transcriptional regulator, regulatory protein of adaptative response / DNA-3-methyladenine glycosylase II